MRQLLALITILLLAGCTGSVPPQTADNPSESGLPVASASISEPPKEGVTVGNAEPMILQQSGCRSYYSSHSVPNDYARRHLPKGFEPYAFSFAGAAGALFTVKSWTCAESRLGPDAMKDATAILYYLAVRPPPSHASESVVFYWLPLQMVFDNETLAKQFQAWGFPAVAGSVEMMETTQGTGRWLTADADGPATEIKLDAIVLNGPAAPGFTVRYFGTDGDVVRKALDIEVLPHESASSVGSVLSLEGPKTPFNAPSVGQTSYQGWADTRLSYVWTPVEFKQ